MGILSSLKKAVKKVFKGVKKVFKKVGKFVGRAMKSKWGKALMIAAAVFTMGTSLAAGGGLFAAGGASGAAQAGGFFSKFVTAGKNILGAFTGGATGAGGAAATAGATAGGTTGGFLAQAAQTAGKFLTSPAGGQLAGSLISGYAQGKMQEEQLAEEERIRNQPHEWWRDEARVAPLMEATQRDIRTPQGLMNRARRVDQYLDDRASRFPTGPGDPSQVYGSYATG